jgi:hypothetical protein
MQKNYYATEIDSLFSSIPFELSRFAGLSIVGQGLKSSVNPEPASIEKSIQLWYTVQALLTTFPFRIAAFRIQRPVSLNMRI